MEIVRASDPVGWTVVPNDTLRDKRLSFRARGLLAYLLSLPPGWRTTLRDIAKRECTEGYDALQVAMRELEQADYMRREKYQDERGRWHTRIYVHTTPQMRQEAKDLVTAVNEATCEATTEGVPAEAVDNHPGPRTENPSSVPPAETSQNRRSDRGRENRTSVNPSLYKRKRRPPPPTPPVEATPPAAPTAGQEEEEETESKASTAVLRVFDALGPVWRIGPTRRARLYPLIDKAIDQGWSVETLVGQLNRGAEGVRDAYAVLHHRLNDLPEAPVHRHKPRRPPWCGTCDEHTRLGVDPSDEQGRPYRCPQCHPSRTPRPVAT